MLARLGMIVVVLLVVAVASLGCGGGRRVYPDGGVDARRADAREEQATCQSLRNQWAAVVGALPKSCGSSSDCAVVGGSRSCDCYGYLAPRCEGSPVNQVAYTASTAAADLARRWWSSSCEELVSGACDCGEGVPECRDGVCVVNPVCRCMCWDASLAPDAAADATSEDASTDAGSD